MIKSPAMDLNSFIRSIFPGIAFVGFIYWRHWYGTEFNNGLYFLLSVLFLVFGVAFQAIYTGVLYFYVIRYIERRTVGIPQYNFHLSVADEIKAPSSVRGFPTAVACASYHLITNASPEFRNQFSLFCAFVHVLFMTAFLCLIFLLHDLIFTPSNWPPIWVWALAFAILFVSGIVADRWQADERHLVFLRQHKGEYIKILREFIPPN